MTGRSQVTLLYLTHIKLSVTETTTLQLRFLVGPVLLGRKLDHWEFFLFIFLFPTLFSPKVQFFHYNIGPKGFGCFNLIQRLFLKRFLSCLLSKLRRYVLNLWCFFLSTSCFLRILSKIHVTWHPSSPKTAITRDTALCLHQMFQIYPYFSGNTSFNFDQSFFFFQQRAWHTFFLGIFFDFLLFGSI